MIYWPAKSPGETEDYGFNFAGLLEAGETITARQVDATGVTRNNDGVAGSSVTVWLSGGTLGTPGVVTCSITTSLGRTYAETAIVPIGEEPISLEAAKLQLRAEGTTADDDLILELIQSAREYVEQYCGIRIVPAAVTLSVADFGELCRLRLAPVQSLVAVNYLDTTGAEQTLGTGVYELALVDGDALQPQIRRKVGQSWPAIRCGIVDAVRVSVVAGYTVAPAPLIRAMKMLLTQWYDQRDGIALGQTPLELPHSVAALLTNYRR